MGREMWGKRGIHQNLTSQISHLTSLVCMGGSTCRYVSGLFMTVFALSFKKAQGPTGRLLLSRLFGWPRAEGKQLIL